VDLAACYGLVTHRAKPRVLERGWPADGPAAAVGVVAVGQAHGRAVAGDGPGIAFNAQAVTVVAQIAAAEASRPVVSNGNGVSVAGRTPALRMRRTAGGPCESCTGRQVRAGAAARGRGVLGDGTDAGPLGVGGGRARTGRRGRLGGVAIARPIRDASTANLLGRWKVGSVVTAVGQERTVDLSHHPEFDRILEAMKTCQGSAWSGIGYRSASPRYASGPDLISGIGSRRYGARWNPKGAFAAIYVSLDLETAMLETIAYHRYYGIPVHQALPRTFVALELELGAILRMDDAGVQSRLGLTVDQLRGDWRKLQDAGQEAVTQAVGRAAWTLGLEGLMVPSAWRVDGVNLVVFPDFVLLDRMKILGS
jgi:RES domain-containing protein